MENMINVAGLLSDEELAAIAGGQVCLDCTNGGGYTGGGNICQSGLICDVGC
ncbi:hypothetical protein [Brevibacillus sp. SYSU BS000544]|uniref:hypothetical protein n=1 Tax=Brevibacillus sp. SYSU BS000544 TaxID=3416443 RepID=UPI003CE5925B